MSLLRTSLQCAVPLYIHEFSKMPHDRIIASAHGLADILATKGDVLQYGGKGCAETFNALAKGIAALSFCPGGVTFMGDHWETPTGGT